MATIDERIVAMTFKGEGFLNGIRNAIQGLGQLKKATNLDGATKGLQDLDQAGKNINLSAIADGVSSISGKFTALSVVGITALANIASKAVDTGLTLVKSLTIDPIKSGLQEYETQLNSVQTILANTQSKGSTLQDVNGALDELNTYADQTIYNFGEMARNIGTFTAAGVDLKTSTESIKGIANLAALSGSNSQQASTAMYQLSQAIAAGKVGLMDWNSVVNAGMGGQVFQDALKDTARASGVAIDDIIAKNGSFRDSLQENWITGEILTKTLSQFTGDLTDAQLESMGYTADQIKEIQALATTAKDAATKVKTVTQLVGTLQEAAQSGWAKSWQIMFGDFEEAKELFTNVSNTLGPMIGAAADARNNLLQGWKDLGGRTAAIDTISSAFKSLMALITPVTEAFKEIFPPMTAQQLYDITVAVRNFVQSLAPSAETIDKVKRTAKGLFAVLDIGWMIIKGVVGVLAGLFSTVGSGTGDFLSVTAAIGDWLLKVRDAIKNGEGLTNFFKGLSVVLKTILGFIGAVISAIVGLFTGAFNTSPAENGMSRITGALEGMKPIGEFLTRLFQRMGGSLEKMREFFTPFAATVGEFFGNLGRGIAEAFNGADFSLLLDTLNTTLLAGLFLVVKKFLSGGLGSLFGDIGGSKGLFSSISGILDGVTGSLEAMQTNLKAKTLLIIAGAIAILTASLVVLAGIDSEGLTRALSAITIMFGQLSAAMLIMGKIVIGPGMLKMPVLAASMILLSTAILILAAAVRVLAGLDWNELARGLVGVIVLLGSMVAVMKLMPETAVPGMIATAGGMVILAVAVKILASAVNDLAGLDWNELARGLVGVGVLLGGLLLFTKFAAVNKGAIAQGGSLILLGVAIKLLASAVGDLGAMSWDEVVKGITGLGLIFVMLNTFFKSLVNPKQMIVGAAAILVVSGAMKILANAFQDFAGLSWDEIIRGLAGMAGALALIVGAMLLLQAPTVLIGAGAITVVSAAMVLLGDAMKTFGSMSWDDIGRGLVVLAGALAILAGAMYLMSFPVILIGAANMIAAAFAMTMLAPAMVLLGGMSWDEIGRGLTVLAASLAILAIGGVLLLPALPGLMGLAVAVTLLGAATLLAGVGLLAFATALTVLGTAGAVGAVGITVVFTAILGLIPVAMEQLGLGIIALANVITVGAPAIVGAMIAILMALLDAIVVNTPTIVAKLIELIFALIDQLVIAIPRFVTAAMDLMIGLLNGIAAKIPALAEAGTNVIVAFITAIGDNLPRVIEAGAQTVLKFIRGLTDSINAHAGEMRTEGGKLALAIVDGMTGGLASGASRAINAARDFAGKALQAAKDVLGIASPSKEFFKIGGWSAEGMANGIIKNTGKVEQASTEAGKAAMRSMVGSLKDTAKIVEDNMQLDPTIRPVLDLTDVKNKARSLGNILQLDPIKVDRSINKAEAVAQQYYEQQKIKDANAALEKFGSTTNVEYNQYNNSPKALSQLEIYRQTNNQISTIREVAPK